MRHILYSAMPVVVGIVVVAASIGALAQRSQSSGKAQSVMKPAESRRFAGPIRNAFSSTYTATLSLSVDPQLQLDAPTQQLYQQMSNAINGNAFVPNDRLTYYSSVNDQNSYTINGWAGFVENVQDDGNGGYLVSIRVSPQLDSTDFDLNSIVCDFNYTETYDVNNGVCNYVGFADPAGLSGQMPCIIQL
jgi:hypothetical protein